MPRFFCVPPILFTAAATLLTAASTGLAAEPPIEVSKPLPDPGVLGSISYEPTTREKEATKGWTENELADGNPETKTLTGKTGQHVGWFGIVRDIKEDKAANETVLLLEMRYFDGITDIHQQIVSFEGGGDFRAVVKGTGLKIKRLSLARVYGKVVKDEAGVPRVDATYVRLWDWGLFSFMSYGKDKTNAKWKALRKVKPEDGYSPHPDDDYYEQILGKR